MKHTTHKTWLTRIGVAIAIITVAVSASFNAASHAQDFDLHITPYVDKAVTCFVYAVFMQQPEKVLSLYTKRIGKAQGTAGAVYRLGYVTGLVDGVASANAQRLGGYEVAKVQAAEYLYKLVGCTINDSI